MPNAQALSIAIVAFANGGRDTVSALRGELATLKDERGRYPSNLGRRDSFIHKEPQEVALEKAAKAIFDAEAVYSEAVLRAITSHGGTPQEVVEAHHAGNAVLVMAATAVLGLSTGIFAFQGQSKQLLDLGRSADRKTRAPDDDRCSPMAPRMTAPLVPPLTAPMGPSMSPMGRRRGPMG